MASQLLVHEIGMKKQQEQHYFESWVNCSLETIYLGNNPVNISPSCGIGNVQTKTTAAGSKARILQQQRFKIQVNIYFGPEHLRTSCYLRMNNAPRRISVAYLDSDLPKGEPLGWPWPYLEKEVNVRNTDFRRNWAFLEAFTLKKRPNKSYFILLLESTVYHFPNLPCRVKEKSSVPALISPPRILFSFCLLGTFCRRHVTGNPPLTYRPPWFVRAPKLANAVVMLHIVSSLGASLFTFSRTPFTFLFSGISEWHVSAENMYRGLHSTFAHFVIQSFHSLPSQPKKKKPIKRVQFPDFSCYSQTPP